MTISIKKISIALLITAFLILSILPTYSAFGKNDTSYLKPTYYKTVTIQYGDTLYDICKTHNNTDMSLLTYIDYIKEVNKLEDDTIYAAAVLLVPQFD